MASGVLIGTGKRVFCFSFKSEKRKRRKTVREKALKLNRELFWKQKRVKAEWM